MYNIHVSEIGSKYLFSYFQLGGDIQKKRDFLGGLRNSQNYFAFTVSFFVCQNMEVLGGPLFRKVKTVSFVGVPYYQK